MSQRSTRRVRAASAAALIVAAAASIATSPAPTDWTREGTLNLTTNLGAGDIDVVRPFRVRLEGSSLTQSQAVTFDISLLVEVPVTVGPDAGPFDDVPHDVFAADNTPPFADAELADASPSEDAMALDSGPPAENQRVQITLEAGGRVPPVTQTLQIADPEALIRLQGDTITCNTTSMPCERVYAVRLGRRESRPFGAVPVTWSARAVVHGSLEAGTIAETATVTVTLDP